MNRRCVSKESEILKSEKSHYCKWMKVGALPLVTIVRLPGIEPQSPLDSVWPRSTAPEAATVVETPVRTADNKRLAG